MPRSEALLTPPPPGQKPLVTPSSCTWAWPEARGTVLLGTLPGAPQLPPHAPPLGPLWPLACSEWALQGLRKGRAPLPLPGHPFPRPCLRGQNRWLPCAPAKDTEDITERGLP